MIFSSAKDHHTGQAIVGWLLFFFSVALIIAGIFGTFSSNWWGKSVWPIEENGISFFIFISITLSSYFLLLVLGVAFQLLVLIPLTMYIGIAGIGPVAAVFWFWVCATLIGAGLGQVFKLKCDSIWQLRSSSIGFSVIGLIVNFCANFPICTPLLFFSLFSILSFSSVYFLSRLGNPIRPPLPVFERAKRTYSESIFASFVLVGITLAIAVTVMPDLGHDALAMHCLY